MAEIRQVVGQTEKMPRPARLIRATDQLNDEIGRLQDTIAEMHGSSKPNNPNTAAPTPATPCLEDALQAAEESMLRAAGELSDIRAHLRDFLLS